MVTTEADYYLYKVSSVHLFKTSVEIHHNVGSFLDFVSLLFTAEAETEIAEEAGEWIHAWKIDSL